MKRNITGKLNLDVFNDNRNPSRSSSNKCDVMGGERECKRVSGREQVLRSAWLNRK